MTKKTRTEQFDWSEWKPIWTQKTAKTPHDYQENHSPSEQTRIRLSHLRKTISASRRIVDARLWDAMSFEQQNAAIAIDHAFQTIGKGLGYRNSRFERRESQTPTYRTQSETDYQADLINQYFGWAKECKREKTNHAAIIDVLSFGKSCKAVDRERKCRNGWAKTNLLDGLDIYCKIMGWKKKSH